VFPRPGARSLGAAVAAQWREFPYLSQLGFTVIVIGTLGDAVAHAVQPGARPGFTVPQQTAHLVILIGMVLTLAGVVLVGRGRSAAGRGVTHLKEVHRAPRHR